ncbi:MAG: hypothetical protein A2176_00630 [Spirochaetes bacterium RBG_13_51_14]|nr:MAG: hypothetical protein A2176_00630 [Spirochaetes bacterium RBG_13_51_14]
MKFKKKYAAVALIVAVVLINSMATLRLLFSVVYPERMLKEVVLEYFKNNLDKAVKFEDLYIDYTGDIVIYDFNVSITSDFNDNISLIKSRKTVITLGFFQLFTGSATVKGLDFYDSDITFIKKYGRNHLECLKQVLDPGKFIKRTRSSYNHFYMELHRARIFYRESLRDRQITLELNRVNAELDIDPHAVSYTASGYIRPYQTAIISKGYFDCHGAVDVDSGDSYRHRIKVDNFDCSYVNEHIRENKIADIALSGGMSIDAEIVKNKDVLWIKGEAETNSLTVVAATKTYNLLSNENLNLDMDLVMKPKLNSCFVRSLHFYDDVFSLEASGSAVRNDKNDAIKLRFKTNSIDLGDLAQNLTPCPDIEYAGTLQGEGTVIIDFKNNTAAGTRMNFALDDFTLSKNERGTLATLIGESSMRVKLTDVSLDVSMNATPLNSDLVVSSRTAIVNWIPFKSDTRLDIRSKKMNLENIRKTAIFLIDTAYAKAYENKRVGEESAPYLQSPLGKFMNNNTAALKISCDTLFYGKKAAWHDIVLDAQLNRGCIMISEFKALGYDAQYMLALQGYFAGDQPYIKLDGNVQNFDCAGFYSDSGFGGVLSGRARCDFGYEVSAARLSDILDNSRGRLNIYIAGGEMRNTRFQQSIMKFLRKNGYEADSIGSINFEDITISLSQQGENFWFSNSGIRGDTVFFNGVADYMYEGGINSIIGVTIRKEGAAVTVPLRLYGRMLAPCIDIYNKKDSQKLCF